MLHTQKHPQQVPCSTRHGCFYKNLIQNMLKLNKLEKQTIRPMPEAFDVCAQLCDCAVQFEEVWERKNITFEADLEESAAVYADAGLCLTMVFGYMVQGIVIGLIGIVALLCLIPLTVGLK